MDEFHQVAGLFKQIFNGPLPDSGYIVVAEQDNQIIAFGCVQQIWHVEPVYVKPEWRSRNVFSKLIDAMFKILPSEAQGAFIITPHEQQGRVLQYLGFECLKDFKVFRWLRKG